MLIIIIITKAPWYGWWLRLIGEILTQCGLPRNKYLLEDVLRGKITNGGRKICMPCNTFAVIRNK